MFADRILRSALFALMMAVGVACQMEPEPVHVTNIILDAQSITLVAGDTYTLTATVTPSNADNKFIHWSSSNASVVIISAEGIIEAVSPGEAKVTATSDDGGLSASCSVVVKPKTYPVTGVTLDQEKVQAIVGDSFKLNATVTPSNATNQAIEWTSSNEIVATVNTRGEVTCRSAGHSTIAVTTEDGGFVAECHLVVTVAVSGIILSDTQLTLDEGESKVLSATIVPEDATVKNIFWESSDPEVATVNEGMVTGRKAGNAIITATTEDGGKTASCEVTVIAHVSGVSLNKTSIRMERGSTEMLTATIMPENASDKTVTWATSDPLVAIVQDGKVSAVGTGSAVITVTTRDGGKTASCAVSVVVSVTNVTLDRYSLSMTPGQKETLTATVSPADATNPKITWKSSSPSVAIVENGVVTALSVGNTTISVTSEDGEKTASCSVKVSIPVSGVSLNHTALELMEGESATLTATVSPSDATNKSVRWSSSDTSVATVDNGKVSTVNVGTCTVKVTTEDGSFSAECAVTVKPDTRPSVWDGSSVSYDWYYRASGGVYHIKSAAELAGLSKSFSQGYYKFDSFYGSVFYLDRDIDLANYEWTPIGTLQGNTFYNFRGTFEGNGHVIKGMKITKLNDSSTGQMAGLFGCTFMDGLSVKNLTVSGSIVVDTSPDQYVGLYAGGIIGYASGAASFENCHTNVEIYANATTGNSITVYVGGIAGATTNSKTLERCSSKGSAIVTISNANKARIGGIAGHYSSDSNVISRCSSSLNIAVSTGKSADIGGIVGTVSGCYEINNCIYSGYIDVYGSYGYVGGIAGMTFSKITAKNCLMVGGYSKTGGYTYLSAVFAFKSDDYSALNTYYLNTLSSNTSYGTAISSYELKSGMPLSGFDSSIWAFPSGSYPYLLFE